jgi:hypothetical protein
MKAILRSSELWVGVITLTGSLLSNAGIVSKELWDQTVIPACIYIVGRIGGKVAKATIK